MGNREGEYSVQLFQAQAHVVPNCVGVNIPTNNSSIQSNIEGQVGTNGINNVTCNGVYLKATSNHDTRDQNSGSMLGKTTNDQKYSRTSPSYFGNASFGADCHSSASNQTPVPDDFFDFLPEIEGGTHGFSKYLGASTAMNYGSIPETHNAFDVEPIFFDRVSQS